MHKAEIAQRIHQEAGISEEEAGALLIWVFDLFKATLQKGEPIGIQGFGVVYGT
jgi:nucleoid DNA-binding protein